MALVGEALLSGSIQVICHKIASREFMDFFRARRFNHSLVDRLKVTLMTLHAVLNDAEEKQIVNPAVEMWLDELKDAVFDAEDLVDEIDTEALHHKAKDQTGTTQGNLLGQILEN
ncbi:putative disease resistance RPP13-like protein 1 [Pyrus x bretschneideri]|uniref:putative disease resistance RPP13-like protein 1 n=1 Tax=Pyrus x bretschneideri TaxID=225117 RepID=UPI0020306F64|nr:putative disease resistance RPP13-like protein 1 [Pyrus x bretschneideri]